MQKNKITALILSSVLALTVLTGCGGTTKEQDTQGETTSKVAAVETTEATKPTLKYLGRFATFDLVSDPAKNAVEEVTGYKVEWESLPEGEAGLQKLLMIAASGQSYDIVAFEKNAYFQKCLSNNVLQPLDELMNEYGPELKAAFADDKWSAVSKDGKVYGFPSVDVTAGAARSSIVVRKDILDSLNLKVPTTLDEFTAVLKELKAKKPDMIPLTLDNDGGWYGGYWLENVMSAFGTGPLYLEEDGVLVPFPMQNGAKDYISFMADLYKEGLIDKEMPALKRAGKNEKFAGGKAVMAKCDWWEYRDIAPALLKNIPDAEIEYVTFFADKDGNKTANAIAGVTGGGGYSKDLRTPCGRNEIY